MIEFTVPTAAHFAKRGEPTGAIVARRITGVDDAREISKAKQERDWNTQPPTRGEKAVGYGALAAIPVSAALGAKGGNALMRRSYRRRVERAGRGEYQSHTGRVGQARFEESIGKPAFGGLFSKGLLAPTNKGPAMKAPTLARTGPSQPKKGKLVQVAQMADDPIRLAAQAVTKGDVSAKRRSKLAGEGKAFKNGSWPIGNAADARNAQWDLNRMKGRISSGKRATIESRIHAVTKAYRSFDPEDSRQRRLGAAAAGGALGGGMLAYQGGRSIQRATRSANAVTRDAESIDEGVASSKYGRHLIAVKNAVKGSAVVPHKAAGKVAGGAALIATSARLMSDRHKKSWR